MYWLWLRRKKRKYVSAVEASHGSFSPFVVMVDDALGPEAVLFLCHRAEKLSACWERSYDKVLGWIKAQFSFAIVRATDLCLNGSRVCWRSGTGIDDVMELDSVLCQCHIKVYS